MVYDPNVPQDLKKLQDWFSGIITQPIDKESHINPISFTGQSIEGEAGQYIAPSQTLKPYERIEIYNQQYWWRLLNTLHETFPVATRLLGYKGFNERIAIPYLKTYPSQHWSLTHLGDRLPLWMKEQYEGDDQELLLDAVLIDCAFNQCFFAARLKAVTANRKPEEVFTAPAVLQPHVFLFSMDYDLFRFRKEITEKDPDFWSSHHYPNLKHALSENHHHFPKLRKGEYFFIIYRSRNEQVLWDDLTQVEYLMLAQFREKTTIEKCCQFLEQEKASYLASAKDNLTQWIEKWIANEWLAIGI